MAQPPAIIRLVSAANVPPPAGIPPGSTVVSWQSDGAFPISNVAGYIATGITPYDLVFSLIGNPAGTTTYPWISFTRAVSFLANFGGSVGNVLANPTATATFTVSKTSGGVTTTVGTISVSTSGVVTFTTTGGSPVTVAAGDYFTLTSPTRDATLAGLMFTLAGAR